MNDRQRFVHLMRSRHACLWIPTLEESEAMELLLGTAVDGGADLRVWTHSRGMREGVLDETATLPDTEHPAAALYYALTHARAGLEVFVDLAEHLDDPRTLRLLRELIEKLAGIRGHVVLVDHRETLPPSIAHAATRFDLSLPEEDELVRLLRSVIQSENAQRRVQAQLSPETLGAIVQNLRGLTRRQARQIILEVIAEDRALTEADLNTILASKRRMLQRDGLLDFVESPVNLNEIAGLSGLKHWLRQRQLVTGDKARAYGLRPPRGVLMLGVPGAGKSLCAKAVATAWRRPLLRLDPSVLYDRYIGESERRLRDALHQAEALSPNVLWIDEIEKGFASAASHSTDGGLSQRMFGTLLTWMQEHTANVFLFATANNIEALPPELLRKGRFDEIFFVDLPDATTRAEIFRIHLAKRNLDPARFDLKALAEAAEGRTGAEIEQAIVAGIHDALAKNNVPDIITVIEALRRSPPLSVTMAERVDELRSWAEGRCVRAG